MRRRATAGPRGARGLTLCGELPDPTLRIWIARDGRPFPIAAVEPTSDVELDIRLAHVAPGHALYTSDELEQVGVIVENDFAMRFARKRKRSVSWGRLTVPEHSIVDVQREGSARRIECVSMLGIALNGSHCEVIHLVDRRAEVGSAVTRLELEPLQFVQREAGILPAGQAFRESDQRTTHAPSASSAAMRTAGLGSDSVRVRSSAVVLSSRCRDRP